MKKFNITGKCIPDIHYMVDISDRIQRLAAMVNEGDYFCINRGRQYGKTTTLNALAKFLSHDYSVFLLSFEGFDENLFQSQESLMLAVLRLMLMRIKRNQVQYVNDNMIAILEKAIQKQKLDSIDFMDTITELCSQNSNGVVLMIDEVDQAGNHESFVKLLGVFRSLFLDRDNNPTFKSIILAGVYDVRNLKLKVRSNDEHQSNSPWNIAVPFEENMSLDEKGIAGMLQEYANDHDLYIQTNLLSKLLVDYTNGYPYMVSRLCVLMDRANDWSVEGLLKATKQLYAESNTLFSDTLKKLDDFPRLRDMLYQMLFCGEEFPYNIANKEQELAKLFDLVEEKNGKLAIANRIYETWLYNKFIADEKVFDSFYDEGVKDKPRFIQNGKLNMPLILERFSRTYTELYKNRTEKFDEDEGRKKFIFFIKPIINGVGNYYVESRTRGLRRTDLVIDYLGKQYIIEMKIWHGKAYHEEGELQLADYLKANEKAEGYILTFNFNKKSAPSLTKHIIVHREILECVV